MTKQQYILKILDSVDNTNFPIGDDIKALIEANQISDELIDVLVHIFKQAVHNTIDKIAQKKLEKWASLLNGLKEKENNSKIIDQYDLTKLEKELDAI